MDITEVRISLRDDAKLKAFASITLDDCFVIRGLKIIQGQSGTFVAMPSRKRKDGDYQDIAHPINNDTRKWMEDIVLKHYREEVARFRREQAEDGKNPSASAQEPARQESNNY